MCGIAGLVWARAGIARPEQEAAVHTMAAALVHRGPDEAGVYGAPGVLLAHRRLAIVDIAQGQQPMADQPGTRVVAYNGEIYNCDVLRSELPCGTVLRTRSDTELLLHWHRAEGPGFTRRLNGMYAFALWDVERRTLQLSRDPLGIKPLYYLVTGDSLLFASELFALVAGMRVLGLPIEVDPGAVSEVLAYGWIGAPRSLVRGVRKLEPGETLLYCDGVVTSGPRTPLPIAKATAPGTPVTVGEVESVLRDAIQRQMVADVPVGVFLSGGIDSSLVTALAASMRQGLTTVTVSFHHQNRADKEHDEAAFARSVARQFNTSHHEVVVNEGDLLPNLDAALSAMDEPIADGATIPLLLLVRHARAHGIVFLCGDGGDELFGGYLRHRLVPLKRWLHRWPASLRGSVLDLAVGAPRLLGRGPFRSLGRRAQLAADLLTDSRFVTGLSVGTDVFLGRSAVPPLTSVLASDAVLFESDLTEELPGQLLAKTDRIAMQAGIEVRVPFLDDEMVRLASRLAPSQRYALRTTKPLLRALAARHLPEQISRRPKHGFRVPLSRWLRGPLAQRVRSACAGPLGAYLDCDAVERILCEHISGHREHAARLWPVLVLDYAVRRLGTDGAAITHHVQRP